MIDGVGHIRSGLAFGLITGPVDQPLDPLPAGIVAPHQLPGLESGETGPPTRNEFDALKARVAMLERLISDGK